jgi:hypothetical protein
MITEQVRACIEFLTGQDRDYANSLNGIGFRQGHSIPGHRLAEKAKWNHADLLYAGKMIQTYRNTQLIPAGYVVPSIEEVAQYVRTLPMPEIKKHNYQRTQQENEEENGYKIFTQNQRIAIKTPFYVDVLYKHVSTPLKEELGKDNAKFNLFGMSEWSYPVKYAATVMEKLDPYLEEYDFSLPEDIQTLLEESRREKELARQQEELEQEIRSLEIELALKSARSLIEQPLSNGITLFAHQKEAVLQIIEERGAILAHNMGLGKTLTSLVTAKAYGLPVFVISPPSVIKDWMIAAQIVEIPIEVYSWAKMPVIPEDKDFVLIVDEAHLFKNIEAQRTKKMLKLADSAYAVIPITGTPMKNGRPIETLPLLMAIKDPIAKNQRAYKEKYCNNGLVSIGNGKTAWDWTGATNLDDFKQKTQHRILYKKKGECMDLPEKIRKLRTAEVSTEDEVAYEQFIQERLGAHSARMQTKAEEREVQAELVRQKMEALEAEGINPYKELPFEELALLEPEGSDNAASLVHMGVLIHTASLAKVETAIAIAEEVMAQGESIILFTTFKDSGKKLADALHCDFLSGDLPRKKRDQIKDRFNNDEIQAVVMTIGAGGVGLTLHKSDTEHPTQTVVLVDRPWSPGDAEQAEDRIHRIGTKNNVTSVWLQYGPLDDKIDALLQEKQKNIDLALEGKPERKSRSIGAMAKEIMQAIEKGVPTQDIIEQMYQGIDEEEAFTFQSPAISVVPLEQTSSEQERPVIAEIVSHRRGRKSQRPYTMKSTDSRLAKGGGRIKKRVDITVEQSVYEFLHSMKAPEGEVRRNSQGYANFIEGLILKSPEYARFMQEREE